MSLHMPITKRRISHHFQYSIWMYLLLVVLALFAWNLIYTTTRYQPPEAMRVEFFVQAPAASEEGLNALADRIHQDVMPDMELVTAQSVTITEDYYGDMQLTVWISAAQGDIYLLADEYFERYAKSGAFLDLQPYVDSGQLDIGSLDASSGILQATDTDFKGLYGIPADGLTGFADMLVSAENKMLCVLFRNGNDEYTIKFLNYLLTHLQ